jgi:hypothetical protein
MEFNLLGAFTGYADMGGVWGWHGGWISLMGPAGVKDLASTTVQQILEAPSFFFLSGEPIKATKSILISF